MNRRKNLRSLMGNKLLLNVCVWLSALSLYPMEAFKAIFLFYKEDDGEPTLSSTSGRNTTEIDFKPASSVQGGASRSYRSAIRPEEMPKYMSWDTVEQITNYFSQLRLIGTGRHGDVYKGVHEDGTIVALKSFVSLNTNADKFTQLVLCLKDVHHQNIVQLTGYCTDARNNVTNGRQGALVFIPATLLVMCFEYLPNGAVDRYISEISSGLDWQARYKIIKGTCEGLRYLHMTDHIQMDLKPRNILLDENMTPKITDVDITSFYSKGRTGSIEYMAPEFIHSQVISTRGDVYSLGIIILEIMTGKRGSPNSELVHKAWMKRLQKTVKGILVGGYCQQVKKCLEIASMCLVHEPRKRPSMENIVDMLNETETFIQELALSHAELLDVLPQELFFMPSVLPSSLELEMKKKAMVSSSSCSLQLNNRGDDRVAFMLVAYSPKKYLMKKPICGVVPPRCAYILALTIMTNKKQKPESKKRKKQKPSSSSGNEDFFTLYSTMLGVYDLLDVDKDHVVIEYSNFFKTKATTAGDDVQEVMLKVICDQPAAESAVTSSSEFPCSGAIKQPTRPTVEIITTPDAQQVASVDVHLLEPWVVTTNDVGTLRVWNYQTMTPLTSFELATYEPVHAAKFITREKWLITGDNNGSINIYSYDEQEHVDNFDAHDSCIMTLVVHPVHPFVLTSSCDDDHVIKLWDWEKGWECTRTFQGHTNRVTQLKFSGERFASASMDGTIKIWSICFDDPSNIMTFDGKGESLLCVDYFSRYDRLHIVAGCEDKTAQIWDLSIINGCVHELEGHVDQISVVSLHAELPMLITGSLDGTLRIWDSTTYKLEKVIGFNLGAVYALGCIMGSRRIMVGCHQGLAMMEIPLP